MYSATSVTQQTAGRQAYLATTVTGITQASTELIRGVVDVTAIPLAFRLTILLTCMRPTVLPVMRMISNLKVDTLVEKAVLSNKTKIALAVDVTGSVMMDFNGCRIIGTCC